MPVRFSGPAKIFPHIESFSQFGRRTRQESAPAGGSAHKILPVYINQFWTSRQREAHSLHEISYRACFKPQLPRFFIERLTKPGDIVYDPFMGRGTTVIEARLLGRAGWGSDINPLSALLTAPRLAPPDEAAVSERLGAVDWSGDSAPAAQELLAFYHEDTLREIFALRNYLLARRAAGTFDAVDGWIGMVATNRLTGHSPGFFSVYTLPPNQAVSASSQRKINRRRRQTPDYRNVPRLILKKTRSLLKDLTARERYVLGENGGRLLTRPADAAPEIPDKSVALVVTSPPFLDIVNYAQDNWLRCWFWDIDPAAVKITAPRKLDDWKSAMARVFRELARVLKPGGHAAFEVGEIRKGTLLLEPHVLDCGRAAGLEALLILINEHKFTKTSHCWGVRNNAGGTNSNRVVLFKKS